jgi:serine/threonine protein kinase
MIGQVVDGTYTVLAELAPSADDAIYLAMENATRRVVDLRFLPLPRGDNAAEEIRRLRREIRLHSELRHPNLRRMLGYGQHAGQMYVALEHVSGVSLQQAVVFFRGGPDGEWRLGETHALRIVRQVAEGLRHAHERGILHRSIGPGAINITSDGLVQITHMHSAKGGKEEIDITNPGTLRINGPYPAPEQARGEATVASDVYALGCLLFELLTGQPGPVAPDSLHLIGLRPDVRELVLKSTSYRLEDRLPDVDAFIAPLSAIRSSDGTTLAQTTAYGVDDLLAEMVDEVIRGHAGPSGAMGGGAPKSGDYADLSPQPMVREEECDAWIELADGTRCDLNRTLVRVGRHDPTQGIVPDIAFDPRWVHRRYIWFERRGATWVVCREAGARHDVLVNDEPLKADQVRDLADGDRILLGRPPNTILMVFRCP